MGNPPKRMKTVKRSCQEILEDKAEYIGFCSKAKYISIEGNSKLTEHAAHTHTHKDSLCRLLLTFKHNLFGSRFRSHQQASCHFGRTCEVTWPLNLARTSWVKAHQMECQALQRVIPSCVTVSEMTGVPCHFYLFIFNIFLLC